MSRRAPGSTDRAGGGAADTAVSATPVPQQQIGPRRHIPGPSLLEVSALRVTYGGAPAVDGFSLTIAPGEIVGLIGPNGAGKSSVLNAVSGDVRPTAGSIRLAGRDVTRLPAHRRARLGMARTSQTARVFEGLTVFEGLVTFAAGAEGASLTRTLLRRGQRSEEAEASELVWRLLDHHGFAHIADLYGRELSGGQRRFVDLAMALIRSPQLLLLDEPLVGVASAILPGLMSVLREAARARLLASSWSSTRSIWSPSFAIVWSSWHPEASSRRGPTKRLLKMSRCDAPI